MSDRQNNRDKQLIEYLQFIRGQRSQSLKELSLTFKEIVERRLANEDTFNRDDVLDILGELETTTRCTLQDELTTHSHMNVVLITQYLDQAESESGLQLKAKFRELENRSLLEAAARFEDDHFNSIQSKTPRTSIPDIQKAVQQPPDAAPLSVSSAELEHLRTQVERLKFELMETKRNAGPTSLAQITVGSALPGLKKEPLVQVRDLQVEKLMTEKEDMMRRIQELEKDLQVRLDKSRPVQNLIQMTERKNALLQKFHEIVAKYEPTALEDATKL